MAQVEYNDALHPGIGITNHAYHELLGEIGRRVPEDRSSKDYAAKQSPSSVEDIVIPEATPANGPPF